MKAGSDKKLKTDPKKVALEIIDNLTWRGGEIKRFIENSSKVSVAQSFSTVLKNNFLQGDLHEIEILGNPLYNVFDDLSEAEVKVVPGRPGVIVIRKKKVEFPNGMWWSNRVKVVKKETVAVIVTTEQSVISFT